MRSTGNNLPVYCRADEQVANTHAKSVSSVASFSGLHAFGLLKEKARSNSKKNKTITFYAGRIAEFFLCVCRFYLLFVSMRFCMLSKL